MTRIFGNCCQRSLPIGWDDPSDSSDLNQLLVDVFHQSTRGTAREDETAHTIPLVAIIMKTLSGNVCCLQKMDSVNNIQTRSTCRAIILQYQPLDKVYHGAEKATKLEKLRGMQNNALSLIGKMIQFAFTIYSAEGFEELNTSVAVEVSEMLSHYMTRISETYPIWLYTMYKV